MRVNESVEISAPPEAVFEYIADPENYLRFLSGVTRWEVVGEKSSGLGARYRVLFRVGAAEVGGLIEMVEWDEPFDIAWHSVTGVDQRGRWRIRDEDDERSKVEFRFAYGVIGGGVAGLITEFAAAPDHAPAHAPHPAAAEAPGRARAASRRRRAAARRARQPRRA